MKTAIPTASVAASEISLYRSVLQIRKDDDLEELGISFWDAQTTIQWSYNADHYFHAASTMKLAVLLGVFRQIDRGELALDSPVHVRNRFTSIVNQEPFMLDLGRDADPDVYGHLGKTLTIRELAYWMITKSSNLATNLLVDVVGIQTIQLALDELEIDDVRILRGVEDPAAFDAGLNNSDRQWIAENPRVIADGRPIRRPVRCDHHADQQSWSGIPAGLRRPRGRATNSTGASRHRNRVSGRPQTLRAGHPHPVQCRQGSRDSGGRRLRDIYNTLSELLTRE
jgi:beta-lactamase class A